MNDALRAAYRATSYEAITPEGRIAIRIGERAPRLDALLARHDAVSWCFVTAWNPASQPLPARENQRRNRALRDQLAALDGPVFEGQGVPDAPDWAPEASFLVLGVSRDRAIALAGEWEQNAVVWGTRGSVAALLPGPLGEESAQSGD